MVTFLWSGSWYENYQQGIRHIKKGNWLKAIPALLLAIKEKPNSQKRARTYGMNYINYTPFFYLGVAYYNLNQFDKAREYFRKEITFNVLQENQSEFKKVQEYLKSIPNITTIPTKKPTLSVPKSLDPTKVLFNKISTLKKTHKYKQAIHLLSSELKIMAAKSTPKAILEQGYYLLAKLYHEVSENYLSDQALEMLFNSNPHFTVKEADSSFKQRIIRLSSRYQ